MIKLAKKFLLLGLLFSSFGLFAQNNAEMTESSAVSEDIYIDDIVSKRLIAEGRLLQYAPIREADIAWQKKIWRVIETREKMNLVFREQSKPFFNILKGFIENGDITVFDDEFFKEPLTFEAVEKKLYSVDTTTMFDPETYEEKVVIIKNTKSWENVFKYRIKEIWFFDKQTSMLRNRILGIAPIYTEDKQGVILESPLFWVYYPEARNIMSKHQVFNENSDVAPMTWSDLFDNRYFTSYIMKKSNVLDYRVMDYFNPTSEYYGIDQLLESERIKAELFNFEHDLWEY